MKIALGVLPILTLLALLGVGCNGEERRQDCERTWEIVIRTRELMARTDAIYSGAHSPEQGCPALVELARKVSEDSFFVSYYLANKYFAKREFHTFVCGDPFSRTRKRCKRLIYVPLEGRNEVLSLSQAMSDLRFGAYAQCHAKSDSDTSRSYESALEASRVLETRGRPLLDRLCAR